MFCALFAGIFTILIVAHFRYKSSLEKIQNLQEIFEKLSLENHKMQKIIKNLSEKSPKIQKNSPPLGSREQFSQEIQQIRDEIKTDRAYFEEKIINLSQRVKNFSAIENVRDIDEKQILRLFREGLSIESIAKELKIGRGEVEFILKISDL